MTASEPTIDAYRAACIQFDVRAGDVAANCAAMRAGIEEAVAAGAVLCVLPELWSTSFLTTFDEDTVAAAEAADRELQELSGAHGLVVVGSAIESAEGRIYNTATVFDRGERLGAYRKIHLFSPNLEPRHHAPGSEPRLFTTRLGRFGVLVCYDLRFPELSRYYFQKGAELLRDSGALVAEIELRKVRTMHRILPVHRDQRPAVCRRMFEDAWPDMLASTSEERDQDANGGG